jgi:probable phosphoglycerate mutase
LDEVDFGRWAGCRFDALDGDPDWTRWNAERGTARAAEGETMAEVQARVSALLRATAARHVGETVVLVSHADVIRAAVADVLVLPLDQLLRFDVDPASMTTVVMGENWARLVRLNAVA